MKKYSIPNFPAVAGRHEEQKDFAAAVRKTIKEMVQNGDDSYFGVVTGGCGGGYVADLEE